MTVARRSTAAEERGAPPTLRNRLPQPSDDAVRVAAGVFGAAAVAFLLVARTAVTVPLAGNTAGSHAALAVAESAAAFGPAAVSVAVGLVADSEWTLVGLVAAGSFALLAVTVPAVGIVAAGVVSIASLLVLVPAVVDGGRWSLRRTAFATLVVGGIVLSLGANTGLLAPGVRSLGSTVALLALAVSPMAVGASPRALGVGVLAAIAVGAGATAVPFAAGAAMLAVGAAVDPGIVAASAGVGGAVAVIAEGLSRRAALLTASAVLLLAAGVPATVPRAVAVVLGAHLLVIAERNARAADGAHRAHSNEGEPA